MKTTNTCTIYFEDGTEISYDNVTYSRWTGDRDDRFVVQHYDPTDESRLQTWNFKREHVKHTVRIQDDTPKVNLSEDAG